MAGPLGILAGKQRKVQFVQQPTGTVISIDCTVSENHTTESPPTEFPIEDGTSVSDHIILKPAQLELQGIISDAPIKVINSAITTAVGVALPPAGIIAANAGMAIYSALAGSKNPSVAAYAQLLQLQANRKPFDVITTLKRYTNMWIKSLSVPRDNSTGQVLVFNVSLVSLILVSPKTVNISVFAHGDLAAQQAQLGKQQKAVDPYTKGKNDVLSGQGFDPGSVNQ